MVPAKLNVLVIVSDKNKTRLYIASSMKREQEEWR
jgi:hypothetical protein